jgi:hypothetical protein
MAALDPKMGVDAGTFQRQLGSLAETIAQKLQREAPKLLSAPDYVAVDMFFMVRQTLYTYSLLFYLSSDERRKNDPFLGNEYSVIASQTVRSMIDALYNITLILENPSVNGVRFRKSGFKKIYRNVDEDEQRYGGEPDWDSYIARQRGFADKGMQESKLTRADLLVDSDWLTLGSYLSQKQSGGTLSDHQQFLKTFTYGPWREYSALSHGGFEGLVNVARYLAPDALPHELRPIADEQFVFMNSLHLFRAAYILLCIITEIQLYFHFLDANIDSRIHAMWNVLIKNFETRELYDQRYATLMKAKGINP